MRASSPCTLVFKKASQREALTKILGRGRYLISLFEVQATSLVLRQMPHTFAPTLLVGVLEKRRAGPPWPSSRYVVSHSGRERDILDRNSRFWDLREWYGRSTETVFRYVPWLALSLLVQRLWGIISGLFEKNWIRQFLI